MRYDRDGDQHYDVTSALIKSIRGSDVDAALHYLARMIEAGEDPRFIARRLVIHASEDVGMADPSALQTAVAALRGVRLRRAARGADPAGAGGHPPGDGTEVERGHRGHRRGARRRQARADRRGARARCGTATTRGRRTSGVAGVPVPARRPARASCPSSTRPTRCAAGATTARPTTASSRLVDRLDRLRSVIDAETLRRGAPTVGSARDGSTGARRDPP